MFIVLFSHYSLFTIRYSLFTILYSLFTIHYSLFSILYSLFTIHFLTYRPGQSASSRMMAMMLISSRMAMLNHNVLTCHEPTTF